MIDSFSHIPILNVATVQVRYSIISVGDVTEVGSSGWDFSVPTEH